MSTDQDAAQFISQIPGEGRIGILYHTGADGVAGAVIAYKTLQRLGAGDIVMLPLGRGFVAHSPETVTQLEDARLSKLIVIGTGSGGGEILPGVPTLVVDHHIPLGNPRADVFINTSVEEPARSTSLTLYDICGRIIWNRDLDWVAAVGVVDTLGPRAPFAIVYESFNRYGRKNIRDVVVLVNAGRRHHDYKVELAFSGLSTASEPADISEFRVAGAIDLERMRVEVQDELWLKAKTQPQFAGNAMLYRFRSVHEVHPLIAKVWSHRYKDRIVIAANEGFIHGRISFAIRTVTGVNLHEITGRFEAQNEMLEYGLNNEIDGVFSGSQFRMFLREFGFGEWVALSA